MANKKKIKKKRPLEVKKLRKHFAALRQRTERGILAKKPDDDDEQVSTLKSGTKALTSNTCIDEQHAEMKYGDKSVVDHDTVSLASGFEDTEKTSQDLEPLLVEFENQEHEFQPISGRHIIDINYLLSQLQEKARHNNLFDCKLGNFQLIGEKRIGFLSEFKFECNMCKQLCLIKSENTDTDSINANIAATTGIVASGIGYSQLEEFFSAMNIHIFSKNLYNKLQEQVYDSFDITAAESMRSAAEEEKELAIAEGRTKNGIPVIDVFVDASWCARSYGSNYKAASGTAAIIGRRTGKIIFLAVKNKYCLVCARAENKNSPPNKHKCFKNFGGSSCSMEGEIITEGFQQSIPMYGIIYKRMIADGDASTYTKVLKADPYKSQNITVEKIECKNHILRNLCKKLRSLITETKFPLAHRKTLTNLKIMSMRKAIVRSIEHHNTSKNTKDLAIKMLHTDITNSLSHAYGDHTMCQDYNCDKEKVFSDGLKSIKHSTFIFRLNSIISNVAAKSRSLVENVNTNIVECFNNVIAKFIGGKRINFALKQGYQGRVSAAVVSFNDKAAISHVFKTLMNKNQSAAAGLVRSAEVVAAANPVAAEDPARLMEFVAAANPVAAEDPARLMEFVTAAGHVAAEDPAGLEEFLATADPVAGAGQAESVKVVTAVSVSVLAEDVANSEPAGLAEVMERKRERERIQKRKSSLENSKQIKKFRRVADSKQKQNDYGPTSSDPDMSEFDLEIAKKEFLKNLKSLTSDRDAIERNTILQRDSSEWLEIRKNLITASNFGPVCKRQALKDTAPLVKNILYKSNICHVASIAHGIENEQQALQKIQQQENVSIEPCGLFIDKDFPFIGATPDGLIGNDVLVEVKCPFSASKIGLRKAIEENKIQILKYNKKTHNVTINKKSNWYFQVQGQLHVTGRRQCLFGIYAGEKEPVHIERIERDDEFWKSMMESKLSHFYHKCLLPEIINPRHTRGMPIRSLTLEKYESTESKENEKPLSDNIPNLQSGPTSSLPTGQCREDLDLSPNKNTHETLGQNMNTSVDENESGPSTRKVNFYEY